MGYESRGDGKRQLFERLLKFVDWANFTCLPISSISGGFFRANQWQNNGPTECLPSTNRCFLGIFFLTAASNGLETTHLIHVDTPRY
jgi:hypothetical protein